MAKYNLKEKDYKSASYTSMVSAVTMNELQNRIWNIIVEQKKYRDKDYSAKRLAEEIGTNTRYVSAVINHRFQCNYSTFINEHRIKDAAKILSSKKYRHLSIQEVAEMVGFANRQSFYAAFYKLKKTTPREYRMENMQP